MEAGLPKPEFEYDSTGLWVTLRKDIFNEEHLLEKGLNERQVRAVMYVEENERVTNREYQALNKVSNRTATYELTELVDKYNLLEKSGAGAGTYYHA